MQNSTKQFKVLVYSSITRSYLPKAIVLAESLKRIHPEWGFAVIFSDILPEALKARKLPFDYILHLSELGIDPWRSWAFGHTIVELCTAVKGRGALELIKRLNPDKIIYLDPDIWVKGSLALLEEMLEEYAVLLTPHLLDIEASHAAIVDAEICTLKHGTYNLGFYAAKTQGQGREFLDWWAARLQEYCLADIPGGLFTDQRWCDLAPCFFEQLHIVRDKGCNVATWNIAHRRISRTPEGVWMAGEVPLRFYHFTGYDTGDGQGMLTRYAADQPDAFRLWDEYRAALEVAGQGQPLFRDWEYGRFSNGAAVSNDMRKLYRSRPDLQSAFPDPYKVEGLDCYYEWWKAEVKSVRICPSHLPRLTTTQGKVNSLWGNLGKVFSGLWTCEKKVVVSCLSVLVAISVVVLALCGLARHYTPVPWYDIWGAGLNFYTKSSDLSLWWAPHNEHRILLARALLWIDYRLLGGTGVPLIVLNYAMLAAFSVIWISLLQRVAGLARWQRVVLASVFVAWCFQWMQNGNMIWPFQIQFFLAYLIPLLSFLGLGRSSDKERFALFYAAAAGGVLSIGTMANGLFVLPLLAIMAAVLRFSFIRIACLGLLSGFCWAIYLPLHQAPCGQDLSTFSLILHAPWSFVEYVLLFLGSPFYHLAGAGNSGFVVGVAAGVVACAGFVSLAWGTLRAKVGRKGADTALSFFTLYVLASGIATGFGRFGISNIEEAATFRYTSPGIMLWACLFCGIIRTGKFNRLLFKYPALILLALSMCVLLNRQMDAMRWPNNHVFERAVGGLAVAMGARDDQAALFVYPDPNSIHRIAAPARSSGISIFGRLPFSAAAELQDWRVVGAELPSADGHIERIKNIDGRFVRLDGWAVTLGKGQPTWGRVIDNGGQVIGIVMFGGLRPDVEKIYGPFARLSGFSGYMLESTDKYSVILMSWKPIAHLDSQ